MGVWVLTVVGLVCQEGAVGNGIAEGCIFAIHVVTAGESSLATFGCSSRVRRLAGAGEDLAVVGEGENRGREVMRRSILNSSRPVLDRHGWSMCLGRLAFIVDFNPDSCFVGAFLEYSGGNIAGDGGGSRDGLG